MCDAHGHRPESKTVATRDLPPVQAKPVDLLAQGRRAPSAHNAGATTRDPISDRGLRVPPASTRTDVRSGPWMSVASA
jgi:hypothetical protein